MIYKRSFVTGATGFIGSHLVARLLQDGFQVRCLVRKNSNTDPLKKPGIELVIGELSDTESLRNGIQGCNYVFHCAAMVSDWGTIREIRQANVMGTRNLLEVSKEQALLRFVYLSTTDIYGHTGQRDLSEEAPYPTHFCNWYTQTKMEAEFDVLRFHSCCRLPIVIIRPATVFGPRSFNVIGGISKAIHSGQMLLINGGKANAGLCYVTNLIHAIMLAAVKKSAIGESFNVTDKLHVTWKEFIDDLADQLDEGKTYYNLPYSVAHSFAFVLEHGYRVVHLVTGLEVPPLLSRQAVQVMGRNQDFNIDKIQSLLGYRPIVDYKTGLKETVKWIQERG